MTEKGFKMSTESMLEKKKDYILSKARETLSDEKNVPTYKTQTTVLSA